MKLALISRVYIEQLTLFLLSLMNKLHLLRFFLLIFDTAELTGATKLHPGHSASSRCSPTYQRHRLHSERLGRDLAVLLPALQRAPRRERDNNAVLRVLQP